MLMLLEFPDVMLSRQLDLLHGACTYVDLGLVSGLADGLRK